MKKNGILLLLLTLAVLPSFSQPKSTNSLSPSGIDENNKLTTLIDLQTTPVKNQSSTGTCWSFATTSFIESELLRLGKGEYDLSEMFIVRHNYINRLKDNYLREGLGNTGEGGNAHDFIKVLGEYGIVPDDVYTGLNYGSPVHNHSELQAFIKAVSTVPLQRKKESEQYYEIVNAVLDTYLGETPESFTFRGVSYTPLTFAGSLGINPDDYVEITSFTHFPFYSREVLEIADNWAMALFYNVPLDELIEIIDYSLSNGFTVNWDGDTSEKGFSFKNGLAVIPPLTSDDSQPAPDHQRRQEGYNNSATTDDHSMHITGLVKDQDGKKYYKTKNSWGPDRNSFGGYLNMSEDYVREKTLFIMVHKDGIPPAIRTKLGL